jgi:hypothetical protein
MTTVDFITALFSEGDEKMRAMPKHPEAHLWPSEVGTLEAVACAQRRGQPVLLSLADARLSGVVSPVTCADPALSPLRTHRAWTQAFLAPDGAGCH